VQFYSLSVMQPMDTYRAHDGLDTRIKRNLEEPVHAQS